MSLVCVQALDGRWNYGPAALEQALRSEEFGTYPDKQTASLAMQAEANS